MKDVIIIGAGPGGMQAALTAAVQGYRVVLIEKGELGGICLHQGCIPTKTFLHALKKTGNSLVDVSAIHAHIDTIRASFAGDMLRQLRSVGVRLVHAEAQILGKCDDLFSVSAGGEIYTAPYLIVATGSAPVSLNIPGLGAEHSLSFLQKDFKMPSSVVVLGAGASGLEAAQIYTDLGVQVTVVECRESGAEGFDRDCAAILFATLKKRGVRFYFGTQALSYADTQLLIFMPETQSHVEIPCDGIHYATGRSFETIQGVENLGLTIGEKRLAVNDSCESSVPGLFVIGDLTGRALLAHAAVREADVAVETMMGESASVNYDTIPKVLYTSPELASVGEMPERRSDRIVRSLPMGGNGKFRAETVRERGLCKVVIERESEIIRGVHIAAPCASEMIATAAMMVQLQLTVSQVRELVFPHPTLNEIIRETLLKGQICD